MKNLNLRRHGSFGFSLVALLILMLLPAIRVAAADLDQEQQGLYQAAKAEGKVVLYTSFDSAAAKKMLSAFEAKYPGIKTEMYRAGSGTVLEKLMSEHEARIYNADVLLFHATMAWYDMKNKGMLLRYDSPVYNDYPKYTQDRGYTITARSMAVFIGYNTNLVPQKTVAGLKRFEDWVKLAEQKEYRGRFSTQDVNVGGGIENVYTMMFQHGEQEAKALYKRLFAAGMRMSDGGAEQMNSVASGQDAFSLLLPSQRFPEALAKKAPVAHASLSDGQPLYLSPMSIYSKATHPSAAKLLFNWWSSQEGQTMVVEETGSYSLRPGLPSPKGFPAMKDMKIIQTPMEKWPEMAKKTDEIIAFFDQLRRSAK